MNHKARNYVTPYETRVLSHPRELCAQAWDALLAGQDAPSPFMRHAYLSALHDSGCAQATTGWTLRLITLWQGDALQAACAMYLKTHSHGEYVFDWSWAQAYHQHGLAYYPKAVVAVPFTPVPGSRLLARDAPARLALVQALLHDCRGLDLSSLHLLFASEADLTACVQAGLMLRHTVQFHWHNRHASGRRWRDFDDFLASLTQDKRKKIRQERRKVSEAGISFQVRCGRDITSADWDLFYRCYERTYLEHGNAPYLNRDFFNRMALEMAPHWLMCIAHRGGRPVATSLIALNDRAVRTQGQFDSKIGESVAYGRYWGALERVDCLHFEACYYQPLQWCLAHGIDRFEGGAQGEHKMARALLPTRATSAHWLAHPAFANAVDRFLEREGQGVEDYLTHLALHSPLRQTPMPG